MNQTLKNNFQWAIMFISMILPVAIILGFPDTYYRDDLADFWTWSQFLKENLRDIYIQCSSCNYPLFGILVSAGVVSRMHVQEFSEIIIPLRLYFSMFDAINVLLIYLILKGLEIDKAPLWAGIIGLLPSSWMGSSVFGQIEGISQSLILFTCLGVVWFNLKFKNTRFAYQMFLILNGGMLSLMILTKQLILFSVISIVFMLVINIIMHSQTISRILRSFALLLFAFIIPVAVIDFALIHKKGYFSHLQYIFLTGSKHGDIVSSNGFNLWTFLVDIPVSSSHNPIHIQLGSLPSISVIPYNAGLFIFFACNLIIVFWYLHYFYKQNFVNKEYFLNRKDILLFVLHIALVNLSFNLFLTGTKERYLYHFYPFVIIATLGLFNRNLLYFLFAGAVGYALFVLAHIKQVLLLHGLTPFLIMFLFYLPLYFYLTILLRQQLKQQHDSAS